MGWRRVFAGWMLVWLSALGCGCVGAQDKPVGEPELDAATLAEKVKLPTLRVYMDLIQVPVLVLDSELGRMKPVDPKKFMVSLDDGPKFRPKHVRQEGDDAITLGILLDLSENTEEMMDRMDTAVAGLAPTWLHAKDHVTVFSLDCRMVRTAYDVAANPAQLKVGVDDALEGWRAWRKEKHRVCARPMGLWDAMGRAEQELAELPGRRVLLVVSDGVDRGSTTKWQDVKDFAQFKSVAVFGLSPNRSSMPGTMTGRLMMSAGYRNEDPFDGVCQMSGGMVMRGDPQYLGKELQRFTMMVRERYILEFSRARNEEGGRHGIDVTIGGDGLAYIRPGGVTVALRDTSGDNDPNVIKPDETDAPEMGKRKSLKTKQ